ncbi:helix-turn-helix domain-containing protein [Haloarchaeobius sp. DFWS5]|uniref:helix-turn-helix domain-containing protein n=1 Tax=Haloarchaeobius sp. DFWS5 TaxID=3446114 RepID=UPI003EBCFD01
MADATPEDLGDLIEQPNPNFREVMSCVFGIHEHETRTYLLLIDQPGSTVEELANQLERDRSNVNRSLSTLLERGLATRERRLLDSGGYVYQYTAESLPEAKQLLHDSLDQWVEHVHEVIEGFDGTA